MRLHQQGDIYCLLCATPCLKRRAVLGALAENVAVHAVFSRAVIGTPVAVTALPAAVANKVGTVDGTPALVAKKSKAPVTMEAKTSKECSLATADDATPAEMVAALVPVSKVPGTFHPTGVVVEILGTEMGDRGRSCE
jgi:hypothetical protein